jgi:cytochrome c peroxidase
MRTKSILLFVIVILLTLGFTQKSPTPIYFEVPKGWPKPTYDFKKNPITEEGVKLGRYLYYETLLSKNNQISCENCHFWGSVFSNRDHHQSHGDKNKMGIRNSISLMNLAWSKSFMWDGSHTKLETMAKNPITNPLEMNENIDHIIHKLNQTELYPKLFKNAFGDETINEKNILNALGQFIVTFVSSNSKYDKVMRNEAVFNENEIKGYEIFKNKCAKCHQEPLFTNQKFMHNGLPIDSSLNDIGRMKISNIKNDYLKFKVPTLRNVQYSSDYMHDGRFETIREVLEHYNSIKKSVLIPKELKKPMNFSKDDLTNLELFLETLSDVSFIKNKNLRFPEERLEKKEEKTNNRK